MASIYDKITITEQTMLLLAGEDAPFTTNLAKKKRVELMKSAYNGIVGMAERLQCDASDLAISLESVLPDFPYILTHVLESFRLLRQVAEEADFEFDPHIWHPEDGVIGHTEVLVQEAIKEFPIEISYESLADRHQSVAEKMAAMLKELGPENPEAQELLAKFAELQGE